MGMIWGALTGSMLFVTGFCIVETYATDIECLNVKPTNNLPYDLGKYALMGMSVGATVSCIYGLIRD